MKYIFSIATLVLLLSGNAHAITLNKCYVIESSDLKYIEKEFNSQKNEDMYFSIDLNSKTVSRVTIKTKAGQEADLIQRNVDHIELGLPEVKFSKKFYSHVFDIKFSEEKFVIAQKAFSIGTTYLEIDLKNLNISETYSWDETFILYKCLNNGYSDIY